MEWIMWDILKADHETHSVVLIWLGLSGLKLQPKTTRWQVSMSWGSWVGWVKNKIGIGVMASGSNYYSGKNSVAFHRRIHTVFYPSTQKNTFVFFRIATRWWEVNVIMVLYVKFSIYEMLTIYRKPLCSKHDIWTDGCGSLPKKQLVLFKLVTDPED